MPNFTDDKIQAVWDKAKTVDGANKNVWRKDACDAWIYREHYGSETDFGWDVDHMFPESLGGDNNINNLQALQWENNRVKADNFPNYSTPVTSDGNKYIRKDINWKFNDNFIITLKGIYPNNKYLQNL